MSAFNSSRNLTRIVSFLSPTCQPCLFGYELLKRILLDRPDNEFDVQLYILWIPMLSGDNRTIAKKRSFEFMDQRVLHFWDGTRKGGLLFGKMLGLTIPAWDVYLLYESGVEWKKHDEPPTPFFWQHQLSAQDRAPPKNQLDTLRFQGTVNQLILRL